MPTHTPSTRRRRRFASYDDDLLEEGPYFDVDGVDVNPAVEGFTMTHNYAHYFWRPYLGNTAFAVWELLLSFCYGDRDVGDRSCMDFNRNGHFRRDIDDHPNTCADDYLFASGRGGLRRLRRYLSGHLQSGHELRIK